MNLELLIVVVFITIASVISMAKNRLTPAGAVAGWVISICIFKGFEYFGIITLTAFFLLGTYSTTVGWATKKRLLLVSDAESRRTAGQVIANGGVGSAISVLMMLFPQHQTVWFIMFSGSFASATADTMSSELGNIYGTSFYNIINFKKDEKGLNGVVSIQGTLFGVLGSAIIAAFYFAQTYNWWGFWIVVLAGTLGNYSDSVLGATLERNNILTNNMVNITNTLIGAISAGVLYSQI